MASPNKKQRLSSPVISETQKEQPDEALIHKTLDELARLMERPILIEASLLKKASSIVSKLQDLTRADLAAPIKGQPDFEAKLDQLVCAQKRARFDGMEPCARNLLAYLRKEKMAESARYWKARRLLYELNDIFQFDESLNKEVRDDGREVWNRLLSVSAGWQSGESITLEQREIIREQILYCACFGNELKRSGDTEEALRLFEWLKKFTETELTDSDNFIRFGTLARLTYHLGSVYRILEQHDEAEKMYTLTLKLLYDRAKRRGDDDPDDHLFIMRRQAMAIGIGFGWVNYTRGFLRRAENALTTARSMLAGSSDPVVPFYIELLYGTIIRCSAGTDPEKLAEAIKSLTRARAEFEKNNHQRYVARACWELCLTYVLMKDYEAAREHLNVVEAEAKETKHPKWRTNVSIMRSRISCKEGDFQGALREAKLALETADQCKSILPKVDAYLTLGEARFYAEEYAEKDAEESDRQKRGYSAARAEFEKALRLARNQGHSGNAADLPSNPKIVAVCNLRIAQCYVREGKESKAKEYFGEWGILRSNVEHQWVRELAGQVGYEIESLSRNFTIPADDEREWNYSKNVAKLRLWLLEQALRKKKNYSDAADAIGVQRATLYQWQDDSGGSSSKRARINGDNQPRKKTAKESGSK